MMQPNEGPAPAGDQQGGGPEEAMSAMQGIQDAMGSLLEGGTQAGMPPEALAKLQEASAAYSEFLDMVSGNSKAPKQAMPVEQAGTGAVPVR